MRTIAASFGLTALLALLALNSPAQTNLINYGQNNGTNAGTVVGFYNIYLPQQNFSFQYGAISNTPLAWGGGSYTTNGMTNAMAFLWQYSVDPYNSNWLTIGTANPYGTNGEFDNVTFQGQGITLYQRIVAVSTNPLPMGAWKTAK